MKDILGRFWSHVDTAGPDDCWSWTASQDAEGYGFFWPRHKACVRAHRFAIELATASPIPSGLCVLHSCDNPSCVNPRHLRVGTRADNMRDCIERDRHPNRALTHCKHGHEFTPENTWRRPGHPTYRVCRACHLLDSARRRQRRKLLTIGAASPHPPVPGADTPTTRQLGGKREHDRADPSRCCHPSRRPPSRRLPA